MEYKFSKKLAVTALVLSSAMVVSSAQAASVLSGTLTVDDIQTTYLSTNNTTDGTELSTNDVWNVATSFSSADLVVGQTYFLHVYGTNVENDDAKNPQGFLGQFSLSGTTHEFATGGTDATSSDFTYGNDGWDEGLTIANAKKGSGANRNVAVGGITPTQWVWADYDAEGYAPNDITDAYFTLQINPTVVPVPGAVWLFGTGLLGFVGMRKKKA